MVRRCGVVRIKAVICSIDPETREIGIRCTVFGFGYDRHEALLDLSEKIQAMAASHRTSGTVYVPNDYDPEK
jgi:hypothetical protein